MRSPVLSRAATPPILAFCDLDGSALDPHASHIDGAARRALDRIAGDRIPIVLCSSKTRVEMEVIQQELRINHPFICESGAAVFVPRHYFGFAVANARELAGYEAIEFGKPYADVVATVRRSARRSGVRVMGFSDMSVEEVAVDCDLPLLTARLAKLREYSEPFRVTDTKPDATARLFKTLRAAGIACASRGHYHYAGAMPHDTSAAFLRSLYREAFDLVTDVPAVHLSGATSIATWAGAVLEIAEATRHRGRPCSR